MKIPDMKRLSNLQHQSTMKASGPRSTSSYTVYFAEWNQSYWVMPCHLCIDTKKVNNFVMVPNETWLQKTQAIAQVYQNLFQPVSIISSPAKLIFEIRYSYETWKYIHWINSSKNQCSRLKATIFWCMRHKLINILQSKWISQHKQQNSLYFKQNSITANFSSLSAPIHK